MQNEPLGGPGTRLAWDLAAVAPVLQLSGAAFVYTANIPCFGVEQISMLATVTETGPGGPTATMRLRWSADGVLFTDEVVEAAGALVVGPPLVQQYTVAIKEWGPLPSSAAGRGYTLLRPAVAHFLQIGVLWSVNPPAATAAVNVWLERQGGGQIQGPQ